MSAGKLETQLRRWEVGAPAPTIKISVWFEYSMIPDQNPEFAELGLCGPREASYAPLRMLSNYRQSAGKLVGNRMVSGFGDVPLNCCILTVELFLIAENDGCRNESAILQDEKIEDFFCRAGALRTQEEASSISFRKLRNSDRTEDYLPAIRWEVGAPAPTKKISVWV